MITLFDVLILCGVLLAGRLSQMPKRAAMRLSLYATLLMMSANLFLESGDAILWWVFSTEMACALMLAFGSEIVHRRTDRFFFRLMATMFALSAMVHRLYLSDWVGMTFEAYTLTWHTLAIMHVLVMIGFADDTGRIVRSVGLPGRHRSAYLPDHR